MFAEVEGIIKRQINVSMTFIFLNSIYLFLVLWSFLCNLFYPISMRSNFVPGYSLFQMSVLPSVQPFHAIAYPIDPLLALEIRYSNFPSYALFKMNATFLSFLSVIAAAVTHHTV